MGANGTQDPGSGHADTLTPTGSMWASSWPKDADEATDPNAGAS